MNQSSSRSPATTVCVYCASSRVCHSDYHDAARRLGQVLADAGLTIVYGGGGVGSMGALADGAISRGGRVIGILPKFMQELEWGHKGLSELRLVEDMRTRKHLMLADSHAARRLLEELFEAITLKRLGFYLNPIVLVNTRSYFDPLIRLLASAVTEGFMAPRHYAIWQVAAEPEDVPPALAVAPAWPADARTFASL